MHLNLLISCMHQKDASIIKNSNVQTDVVIVNQCDTESVEEFDFVNKKGRTCHAKFICTTERGLSKSRNMAIRNAWGDVCLLCDDDEYFVDDVEDLILGAFSENPKTALIAFALKRNDIDKTYPKEKSVLKFKQILKTSSLQLAFSREQLIKHHILFDEKMGSGTGNGGGEENMFIFSFKRKGLKMLYYPSVIAIVNPGDSQWFHGYDEKFFINMGWANRRILGSIVSFIYLLYWPIFRRSVYQDSNISILKVYKCLLKGFFLTR